MKNTILLFALFLSGSIIAQNVSDKEAVEERINNYFEGSRTDNPELLKKAFHPNATLKFIGDDGTYKMIPIQKFFGFFTNSKTREFESKIYYIDISETAANVKLSTKYETYEYIDYMNMLKTKEGWKIVSKISHKEVF
ncbi:nuclear transport factor 2 family protein [Urechidicola vernalis]|uniref:Nuclear transport factor 2 family protein n=1 Tax=Urechidicola vernalis TaxID=3075600 RepID=A0ABU2Y6V2_9FLAO|nr:nuclear transport factor 2 family protein [Urechidicola sp. P050]MDT0553924.1 nuclear transport factor 2 family protein [Urechidicola sp. P050]